MRIPENKIGDWSISYDAEGHCVLKKKNHIVMSEEACELNSLQEAIDKSSGRVLVLGLGLGYTAREIAKKNNVISVTVVDNSQDVKDLVWEHLDLYGKGNFILDDANHFLETTTQSFDFIEIDCFLSANPRVYRDEVLPLRLLAEKLVPSDKIIIWQEFGEMQ